MDIATIIGLAGAFVVMAYAVLMDGHFGIFFNVPSILIVFGGSLFVVFAKFSVQQVPVAFKSASKAFFHRLEPLENLIQTSFNLATAVRKHGVLALESIPIHNPFLAKGILMLVDGIDPVTAKSHLEKERYLTQQRHDTAIRIFRSFADVAPGFGMIGTLIGLVQMLSQMQNPNAIGPAMAVAVLTTLYGAIIANVVANPIADKLSLRSEEQDQQQALIIDAIECIANGVHPNVMKDVLQNYLPKNKRLHTDFTTVEKAS